MPSSGTKSFLTQRPLSVILYCCYKKKRRAITTPLFTAVYGLHCTVCSPAAKLCCCSRDSFNPSWHRFNEVLDAFLRFRFEPCVDAWMHRGAARWFGWLDICFKELLNNCAQYSERVELLYIVGKLINRDPLIYTFNHSSNILCAIYVWRFFLMEF